MSFLTLTPAYGRDYKNKKDVEADWTNRKDFMIASIGHLYNGSYCSINDASALKEEGYQGVGIRYKGLRNQMLINF